MKIEKNKRYKTRGGHIVSDIDFFESASLLCIKGRIHIGNRKMTSFWDKDGNASLTRQIHHYDLIEEI